MPGPFQRKGLHGSRYHQRRRAQIHEHSRCYRCARCPFGQHHHSNDAEGIPESRSLGVPVWSCQSLCVEGTGSYGAGPSRDLLAKGHKVLDVMHPNRQLRYLHSKSDFFDAASAARSLLNGQATAHAKAQNGSSEMIRHPENRARQRCQSQVASDHHAENIDHKRASRTPRYTRCYQGADLLGTPCCGIATGRDHVVNGIR